MIIIATARSMRPGGSISLDHDFEA